MLTIGNKAEEIRGQWVGIQKPQLWIKLPNLIAPGVQTVCLLGTGQGGWNFHFLPVQFFHLPLLASGSSVVHTHGIPPGGHSPGLATQLFFCAAIESEFIIACGQISLRAIPTR